MRSFDIFQFRPHVARDIQGSQPLRIISVPLAGDIRLDIGRVQDDIARARVRRESKLPLVNGDYLDKLFRFGPHAFPERGRSVSDVFVVSKRHQRRKDRSYYLGAYRTYNNNTGRNDSICHNNGERHTKDWESRARFHLMHRGFYINSMAGAGTQHNQTHPGKTPRSEDHNLVGARRFIEKRKTE